MKSRDSQAKTCSGVVDDEIVGLDGRNDIERERLLRHSRNVSLNRGTEED